jgi:hypothetical protein
MLNRHPAERDLIGKIILAYGVLEVALLETVKAALDGDGNTATRTIFRLKSVSNRLEVADALVRPKMASQSLLKDWETAYAATKFCKGIRNTYAHSQWISDEHGVLRFGDLDKAAKTHGPKCEITLRPLNKSTLERQFAYFTYADHLILRALDRYQLATGQDRKIADGQYVTKPKRVPLPKLDSRGEVHSLQLNLTKKPPPQEAPLR